MYLLPGLTAVHDPQLQIHLIDIDFAQSEKKVQRYAQHKCKGN